MAQRGVDYRNYKRDKNGKLKIPASTLRAWMKKGINCELYTIRKGTFRRINIHKC